MIYWSAYLSLRGFKVISAQEQYPFKQTGLLESG